MSEQVKWLRQVAEECHDDNFHTWGNTCEQAADKIAELQAEVVRLRHQTTMDDVSFKNIERERDLLRAELAIYKGREEAKQLVINQLEAEVEKLTAEAERGAGLIERATTIIQSLKADIASRQSCEVALRAILDSGEIPYCYSDPLVIAGREALSLSATTQPLSETPNG